MKSAGTAGYFEYEDYNTTQKKYEKAYKKRI